MVNPFDIRFSVPAQCSYGELDMAAKERAVLERLNRRNGNFSGRSPSLGDILM
jgi:hypothetical protein